MKKNTLTQLLSAMTICALLLSLLTSCSSKKDDTADVGVPNPMTEISPDELPIPMDTPEGSADIQYYILNTDEEPIYQVSFTYNGSSYTYRAQSTDGFDAYDMSGLYYDNWDTEPAAVGYCDAMVQTNDQAAAVYWLDVVPGINYTLGCTSGISAEELLAVANAAFASAQGEAEGDTEDDVWDFIPLSIPDGAENPMYSAENGISQVEFDYDGAHYVYRAQLTGELEAYDMSGVECSEWKRGTVSVGYCDAIAQNCDDASVIYWLDIVPGVNYTLSCDRDLSAEELLAVANKTFSPLQGDVDGDTMQSFNGTYADDANNAVLLTYAGMDVYEVEIGIYRLSTFEGEGRIMDDTIEFIVTDPNGGSIDGIFSPAENGTYSLVFTNSTWNLLESGTTFEGFIPAN